MDKFNFLKNYLSYISSNDLIFHECYYYNDKGFIRVEIHSNDIFIHLINVIGIGELRQYKFIPEHTHRFALIAIGM